MPDPELYLNNVGMSGMIYARDSLKGFLNKKIQILKALKMKLSINEAVKFTRLKQSAMLLRV